MRSIYKLFFGNSNIKFHHTILKFMLISIRMKESNWIIAKTAIMLDSTESKIVIRLPNLVLLHFGHSSF